MIKVLFDYEECFVEIKDGRIQLYSMEGESIETATSYFKELKDGEFAIKDYSENHGMYASLLQAGIIESHHRMLYSGFCMFPVVRLNNKIMGELKNEK